MDYYVVRKFFIFINKNFIILEYQLFSLLTLLKNCFTLESNNLKNITYHFNQMKRL